MTHGKDPDAGKDWRQEEKGMTEDEMVVRHHWLDGLEFEHAPGGADGREAWHAAGVTESDMTDWTELNSASLFPESLTQDRLADKDEW